MDPASITIGVEPEEGEDARRCVAAYFRELDRRFEGGFDPEGGGYDGGGKRREGRFLIARLGGRAVGCGALVVLGDGVGEIKRMWLAPDVRGRGLSRLMLRALEDEARSLGLARLRLDTNRALTEAQALYRKAGYRAIERYNDNSYADFFFEKLLQPGKSSPISR